MNLTSQACVTAYKDCLRNEEKQAIGTCTTKLSHVKKYLDVAHKEKVYTNFFKGQDDQVNPHEFYKEEDVLQLIEALKDFNKGKYNHFTSFQFPRGTLAWHKLSGSLAWHKFSGTVGEPPTPSGKVF